MLVLGFTLRAAESPTTYQVNKASLKDVAKIYLAYEARHTREPGMEADLKLPDGKQFVSMRQANHSEEQACWVYPVSLGLEIKIGTPQKRVIVIAPEPQFGRYLLATEDLKIHSYYRKDIQRILDAIQARKLNDGN